MRGKFNWKLAIVLGLLVLLVSVGWFGLHQYQMRGMYGAFLEQATRDEDKGRTERAARFLRQYLLLRSDDVEVRARYGILLEKLAKTGRARRDDLTIYEQVLVQDPNNQDIRKRAALQSMQLGLIDNALEHLGILHSTSASDAEIYFLMGECHEAKKTYAKAEANYRQAVAKNNHAIDPYIRLANLLRGPLKSPEKAALVLDDLVKANPESFRAYLARASFQQQRGADSDLAGAEKDLVKARLLAPDDLQVLLVSAAQRVLEANAGAKTKVAASPALNQARDYLQRAIQVHPNDWRGYAQLARLELLAQRRQVAIAQLRAGQKKVTGRERAALLWDLAILLVEGDEVTEAKDAIEQMRKLRIPSAARLDFLRAKLAAKQGTWRAAVDLLEEARPLLADAPELVVQADLLLARCFEQMGDMDRQLAIYRRAQEVEPLSVAPRFGVTTSLLALGRVDEAIASCRQMLELPQAPAGGWLMLSRLLILRNFGLQPSARRWDEVDRILDAAAKANPKIVEISILRAEVLAAKEKLEQARKLVKQAQAEFPKESEPWIALANLAGREGRPSEALRILREAGQTLGDLPELRLAKLRYMPTKKEEALAFLRPLTEGWERLERTAQGQLLSGLAWAYDRIKEVPEAEKLWNQQAQLEPNKLQVRLLLFDLYLHNDNRAGMEKTLEAIRGIEGPNGPLGHFGEASLLIWRARKGEARLTEEARIHLRAAAAKRPRWSRIALALAGIAEIEGNQELMIEHYRQAVMQGDRQPQVVRRLAELLRDRKQLAEAWEIIHKLQETAPISEGMQKLAAEISLFNQLTDQALEFARSAVNPDSKDPNEHLWFGQVLLAVGKQQEAEAAFQKAIDIGGDAATPWVAMVQFHVHTKETKKAQAVIDLVRKKVTVEKQPYLLAQCYQALADREQAEKNYLQAAADHPMDQQIRESLVRFYQYSGQAEKAKPLLEKMLQTNLESKEPIQVWVRRNLAMAVGFKGNAEQQREALRLVEANLKFLPNSLEDQLVKGIILATQPDRRREAISLLEGIFKLRAPTPDQEFLMANLYEAEGDWPKARTQMLHLLTQPGKNDRRADYMAVFVGKLVKRKELGTAKEWLTHLQELRPNDYITLDCLAMYYAEYYAGKGNGDEILSSIKKFVHVKDLASAEAIGRLGAATDLLIRLSAQHPELKEKLLPEAEQMLRTYVQTSGKPESKLALANFLAGQQRLSEALDLCEQSVKIVPADKVAAVAVAAIAMNAASSAQFKRVEGWLQSAKQHNPKLPQIDLLLASLRERQERYAEAETIYLEVVKNQPENVVALNNLAFMLGLLKRGDEALPLIKKALDLAGNRGPVGELLDSRAAILLAMGKHAQAQKDLQDAIKLRKTETRLFHLAEVHLAAGRTKEAIRVFEEARARGLRVDLLHPLERDPYQSLRKLHEQSQREKTGPG